MVHEKRSSRRRVISSTAVCAAILLCNLPGMAQSAKPSLQFSCEVSPFVSVSVSTLSHDNLPKVQLKVIDPQRRQQGFEARAKTIPQSQYANVVQVPGRPSRSRVRAVEICGAPDGQYQITLGEDGEGVYVLAVQVGNESLFTNLQAHGHGTRHYRFAFHRGPNDKIDLMWIDRNGKPQVYAEEHLR